MTFGLFLKINLKKDLHDKRCFGVAQGNIGLYTAFFAFFVGQPEGTCWRSIKRNTVSLIIHLFNLLSTFLRFVYVGVITSMVV